MLKDNRCYIICYVNLMVNNKINKSIDYNKYDKKKMKIKSINQSSSLTSFPF